MPTPVKLTSCNVFSGAAGNGVRRLAFMGTAAVLILGTVGAFALAGERTPPVSKVAKMPNADPLPGGPNGSALFHELARDQAKEQGRQAEAAGSWPSRRSKPLLRCPSPPLHRTTQPTPS